MEEMKGNYDPKRAYGIMQKLVGTVQLPKAVKRQILAGLQDFAAGLADYQTSRAAKKDLTAMLDKSGLSAGQAREQLMQTLGAVVDAYLTPDQETAAPSRPTEPSSSPFDRRIYPKGTRYAVVSPQDITDKLG